LEGADRRSERIFFSPSRNFSDFQQYHGTVIDLLRSFFSYQAWADAAILEAVQGHPKSLRG
jgi:hypothetical protein